MRNDKKPRVHFDVAGDNEYMAFMDSLRGMVRQAISLDVASIQDLAARAHLHPNTVRRFVSDTPSLTPRIDTVHRLLRGIGRSFAEAEASDKKVKRRRKTAAK